MTAAFDTLIAEAADRHGLEPNLVKAIVAAESSFNPRAYRREERINDASYGLMQTLYATARDMGYQGPPEGLFVPENSLEFGCRYLKRQLIRYGGSLEPAIAAYNSGTARKGADGRWINQAYVSRVLGFLSRYRADQQIINGQRTPAAVPITPGVMAPALPAIKIAGGEDEAGRRLVTMETLFSPQTAPYILGGLAILGAILFAPRRR